MPNAFQIGVVDTVTIWLSWVHRPISLLMIQAMLVQDAKWIPNRCGCYEYYMVVMGTLTHIITYVTCYASAGCQMDSKQVWLL